MSESLPQGVVETLFRAVIPTENFFRLLLQSQERGLKIVFSKVAIGDSGYTPTGSETALRNELERQAILKCLANTEEKYFQIFANFPGTESAFLVREFGIFAQNPDGGEDLLVAIWSHPTLTQGEKTVGNDIYFEHKINLFGQIDPGRIEIVDSVVDNGVMFAGELLNYLAKEDVCQSLSEQGLVPSLELHKALEQRTTTLEIEEKLLNIGDFPKVFAPLFGKQKPKILEHTQDNNGNFAFSGGEFFLLGEKLSLQEFHTDRTESFFDIDGSVANSSDELVPSIALVEGEKLLFFLEKTQDSFALKTLPEEAFEALEDVEGTHRIAIATFTKRANWRIEAQQIENLDLVDKHQTLRIDCATHGRFCINPVSDYILNLENILEGKTYQFEVQGHNSRIESIWENAAQAELWLRHSKKLESFEVRKNSRNENEIRSFQNKPWHSILAEDIGRIHLELCEPQDAKKSFPLSAICDKSFLAKSEYPDFAKWAQNPDGSLSEIAKRLGIEEKTEDGVDYISTPDFSEMPFQRAVFDDIGRFQEDALETHTHKETLRSGTRPQGGGPQWASSTTAGKQDTGPPEPAEVAADETRPKNVGFLPLIKVL